MANLALLICPPPIRRTQRRPTVLQVVYSKLPILSIPSHVTTCNKVARRIGRRPCAPTMRLPSGVTSNPRLRDCLGVREQAQLPESVDALDDGVGLASAGQFNANTNR